MPLNARYLPDSYLLVSRLQDLISTRYSIELETLGIFLGIPRLPFFSKSCLSARNSLGSLLPSMMAVFRANSSGDNAAFRANLDSVGQLYLGLLCSWTALLTAGIVFLYVNRDLQFLRIRNISLGISAVCVLHVYWILCMLVYVLNGYFPCGLEFWIMSIYLPLGIGLYQAASTQLLYVAGLQQQYTVSTPVSMEKSKVRMRGPRGYLQRWKSMKATDRAMLMIGAGGVATV